MAVATQPADWSRRNLAALAVAIVAGIGSGSTGSRTPATVAALAMGVAATSLISFCFLTQMHERYSYAAIVFLLLLLPDRRALALEVALSVVFVINLAAAASLVGNISQRVDLFGPNAIAGSGAMIVITLLATALVVVPAVRRMRRDTNGGSGAATSGA